MRWGAAQSTARPVYCKIKYQAIIKTIQFLKNINEKIELFNTTLTNALTDLDQDLKLKTLGKNSET